MSTPVATLAQLRRDLQTCARVVEAPYDSAVVDPVLDTLADAWTGSVVGIRTTSHPVGQREVNARVQYPGDPAEFVDRLRVAGLLTYSGHPIERLLAEIVGTLPVRGAVDVALGSGVQKVWFVLAETIPADRMLGFPGIPAAARAHADHLNRYGGEIGIVALDFAARTMNLYSQILGPDVVTAAAITTMLADLGLVPATEDELALFGGTFNVYRTFAWEAPGLRRICFPRRVEANTVPRTLDPVLATFADNVPIAAPERRFTVYAAYGPADRYYKIQAEYAAPQLGAFPGGAVPPVR